MAKKSTSKPYSIDATTDFLPGAQILLVDGEPGALPSQPINRYETLMEVIRWGPNNNLPQDIILRANQSPELLDLIAKLISFLYGRGLYYEVYDSIPTGNQRPTYVEGFDPEVEDWIAYNNPNKTLFELFTDLVWFNHAFPEMIKNKKGDKIVQMGHNEGSFCRFQRQTKNGYSENVYINAQWPMSNYADVLTIKVPAINPKDFNKVLSAYNLPDYKFIFPISFHSPGKIAYKSANWHSVFFSKWFDVSTLIPVLKHALMKFTMTIKYIIEVPEAFWVKMAFDKGKDWAQMKWNEKKTMRREITEEMNDFLTGAENAGKSFVTTFGWDQQKGVKLPGIMVTALDDKLKDGVWLEDSKEASSHFTRAMGFTNSIVGATTGKGMGAGSGSDASVQFNILNNSLEPKRDRALDPYNFVAQYNGWTQRLPGFRWRIREYQLNTLDQNHERTNPLTPPDSNAESDQQQ